MKEFNQAVLGGYTIGHFAGLLLWAIVGAYIIIQFNANTRDPKSDRTPVKFSWIFWFRDNVRRVIFNLVLIITALRFGPDMVKKIFNQDVVKINEFWALIIGLSSDLLALAFNKLRPVNLIGTSQKTTGKAVDEILEEPGDKTIVVQKKEGEV